MRSAGGKSPESPFTDEVRSLALRIFQLEPGEERNTLVMELADLYASQGDWSDLGIPEDLHSLMEEYLQTKAETGSAAFRLGRFVLRAVGAWEQRQAAMNQAAAPPDAGGAGKKAVILN